MSCTFQCTRCQEALTVPDEFIGRSILCNMCEKKLTVPQPDPHRILLEQDFQAALEHYKISDWDRVCAKKTLELNMAGSEMLRKALYAVRRAARHGEETTLNDELLKAGAFDKKADLALRELIKGATKQKKMVECPNCFASIPQDETQCRYCSQHVGNLQIYALCPNCKRNQPMGPRICGTCGADIETGLKPDASVSHCPRCNYEIRGQHSTCPRCRVQLSGYWLSTQLQGTRRVARVLQANLLNLIVLGIAVGGIYAGLHWDAVKLYASRQLKGENQAALDVELARFDTALKFSDLSTLSAMIDPDLGKTADQNTRAAIVGANEPGAVIDNISTIEHAEFAFDPQNTSATVYTKIIGTYKQESIKAPDVSSSADLQAAAQSLLHSGKLNAQMPWKWVRRNGRWYFSGPLPQR